MYPPLLLMRLSQMCIRDRAVAVLDTLNTKKYEKWWTPEWMDAVNKGLIVKRDLDGGLLSRDMTLYVDEDGKACHIYSSEENLTLQIAELSDDYLSHTGNYVRVVTAIKMQKAERKQS